MINKYADKQENSEDSSSEEEEMENGSDAESEAPEIAEQDLSGDSAGGEEGGSLDSDETEAGAAQFGFIQEFSQPAHGKHLVLHFL